MKVYKTQEERAEIIEWLRSDTRAELAKKSAISYATICQLKNNPEREVGLQMVARIGNAIREWKRLKYIAAHKPETIQPAPAPAPKEPQRKDLHCILLDLIQAELIEKTEEQLVGIYKAILKA